MFKADAMRSLWFFFRIIGLVLFINYMLIDAIFLFMVVMSLYVTFKCFCFMFFNVLCHVLNGVFISSQRLSV